MSRATIPPAVPIRSATCAWRAPCLVSDTDVVLACRLPRFLTTRTAGTTIQMREFVLPYGESRQRCYAAHTVDANARQRLGKWARIGPFHNNGRVSRS